MKKDYSLLVYDCQQDEQQSLLEQLLQNCGIHQDINKSTKIDLDLQLNADNHQLLKSSLPVLHKQDMDAMLLATTNKPSFQHAGMLFMDMDSTLIQCECIDEIADFLGIKAKISAITASAMRGELDFSTSLQQRVKLLAGLEAHVLDKVYSECIMLTDGAKNLIDNLHDHGWKVGLVSGGFDFFTSRLQQRLQLDFTLANSLEIIDGKLTGNLLGCIIDGQAKKEALLMQRKKWHILPQQTLAVGDGANDLPMLATTQLGIAFHAKPAVCQAADCCIVHGGLDRILDMI
ncbi:MAG: phosphoserine phosphatase SerB [Mariprofundales bacterium]